MLEGEHLGHKLMPIWDAGVTTYYATTWAPKKLKSRQREKKKEREKEEEEEKVVVALVAVVVVLVVVVRVHVAQGLTHHLQHQQRQHPI